MLKMPRSPRARMQGLSLIELMIALVVGLIVSGAAVALVVSIMKSNAETIRATRLTQELRTSAEIIGRELRRARSVSDPIANVGLAKANMLKACDTISPVAADGAVGCATFGYDCNSATNATFKAIGLAGGKVRLVNAIAAMPACPTTATGIQLSSDTVTITSLTFRADATNADKYTISIMGKFNNDPTGLVRSISQVVRVRSQKIVQP